MRAATALFSRPTFVLYHASCADGFGAAFAAWCALGDGPAENPVRYLPVQYGEAFPEIPDEARVFIVDFSYPFDRLAREALCVLADRCELTVIDHHLTAREALAGLDFAVFDMEKSGAVLTWEYFQGKEEFWDAELAYGVHGPAPELLLYIQDRDLWRWDLPNSREFNAGLALVPREFERWLGLVAPENNRRKDLVREGAAVLKRDQVLVESMCKGAHVRPIPFGCANLPMLTANAPVLQSEVCQHLLATHPDESVVAVWFDKDATTRVWSLRSAGGYDCTRIAKANGGGGHAAAAGFTEALPG